MDPSISILLPTGRRVPPEATDPSSVAQRAVRRFLEAAVESVLRQTVPHWKLLIIVDEDTPQPICHRIHQYSDPRLELIVSEGTGLAGAINTGMRRTKSDFVCILLSDDVLDRRAIATVQTYVRRFPQIDFFYSSRRYIDNAGKVYGPFMASRAHFRVEDLAYSSPVKHLLAWRRTMALEVGGLDERFSAHGCDDRDFPWTMAQAGARFKAIPACLYYHRNHNEFFRLTTHTPIRQQVDILVAMYRKHQVPEGILWQQVRNALETYILADSTASHRNQRPPAAMLSCYGEIAAHRLADFLAQGYCKRHFFPHRLYFLPKGGPDGLKLAQRMVGVSDPQRLYEIVMFADDLVTQQLPEALFFDDDIVWHQQQFGRKGQVASANIVLDGKVMYGMAYVSDLFQRISRQRQHKTRVEKVFQGWSRLLFNALLVFAIDHDVDVFYSTTAYQAVTHTDLARRPDDRLFKRIYDDHLQDVLQAERHGPWWRIEVARNRPRALLPERRYELADAGKIICLCHDIERGLALEQMLASEARAGIRCTYNVVGSLLPEIREQIEQGGHAVGFHSFDHILPKASSVAPRLLRRLATRVKRVLSRQPASLYSCQLQMCRALDYRIKGYCPPQSRITADLTDVNLAFYNFEWLATSAYSLGVRHVHLQNGIVKIPIHLDDHRLYTGQMTFEAWRRHALDLIAENDFIAISLHDCYGRWWLPHYDDFLDSIRTLGRFLTCDEVAAETFLTQGL